MPTAATLLHDRLAEQQRDLVAAEAAVRRGEPEGIHDLRVAMRRIRSALASFRPIVDAGVTDPLRDELRWAGGRLGEARDAEVVAERIVTLLDEVAADTPPEVLDRLRDRVHADAAAVRDVAVETLDSERYAAALRPARRGHRAPALHRRRRAQGPSARAPTAPSRGTTSP